MNLNQLKQIWSNILSCSVAWSERRYTWRHEKILSVLADSPEKARETATKGQVAQVHQLC